MSMGLQVTDTHTDIKYDNTIIVTNTYGFIKEHWFSLQRSGQTTLN